MAAYAGTEGASAPSAPMCRKCGRRPRWTVKHRGQIVVVSEFCYEHANVPLFDVPAEPVPKPKQARGITFVERDSVGRRRKVKLNAFHAEVRRRRLERERGPRDAA
jgi:hypothetical protein